MNQDLLCSSHCEGSEESVTSLVILLNIHLRSWVTLWPLPLIEFQMVLHAKRPELKSFLCHLLIGHVRGVFY